MSNNLLEMIKEQVSASLARGASNYLGASESVVSEVLEGIFPVLLRSTIVKCNTEKSTSTIEALIRELDLNLMQDFENIFNETGQNAIGLLSIGERIVEYIVGDKMALLVDYFTRNSKLGGGTTSSLIKIAAPFLFYKINSAVDTTEDTALIEYLSDQNTHLMHDLPSGLITILRKIEE